MPSPLALPPQTTTVDIPKVIVVYAHNNDDDIQMLYESTPDPARQVTIQVSFDLALKVAFLKLCVPVPLQGFSDVRPLLFLHLDPSRIASLSYVCPDEQPTLVNEQLGAEVACLRFSLHQPPDMIVPRGSLAPRNRDGRKKLGALKALAQQTRFDVYFAKGVLEDAAAHELCDLVAAGNARTICQLADLTGLYAGKSGTVFTHPSAPPHEPYLPAYNELTPALLSATPEKVEPSRASALGKHPRATELDQDDVEVEQSAQQRQRVRGELEDLEERLKEDLKKSLLADLKKSLMEDLKKEMRKELRKVRENLKEEMMEHVDWRINKLDPSNAYSRSEVDDRIQQAENDNEDLMETKIEDSRLNVKGEMEEYIEHELQSAEERVLKRLGSAKWVLDGGSV